MEMEMEKFINKQFQNSVGMGSRAFGNSKALGIKIMKPFIVSMANLWNRPKYLFVNF